MNAVCTILTVSTKSNMRTLSNSSRSVDYDAVLDRRQMYSSGQSIDDGSDSDEHTEQGTQASIGRSNNTSVVRRLSSSLKYAYVAQPRK